MWVLQRHVPRALSSKILTRTLGFSLLVNTLAFTELLILSYDALLNSGDCKPRNGGKQVKGRICGAPSRYTDIRQQDKCEGMFWIELHVLVLPGHLIPLRSFLCMA